MVALTGLALGLVVGKWSGRIRVQTYLYLATAMRVATQVIYDVS